MMIGSEERMMTDSNTCAPQPALTWIDRAQPGIDTKKGRTLMYALLKTLAIGAIVMTTGLLSPLTVGAHSPARTAAAATCQGTQLAIAPDFSSGATGHIGIELRLHNVSAQACTLQGYATIVLLDGARQPLLTVLRWGPGGFFNFNRPVRLVTVAPGGNAYLAVGWAHIPTPGQSCPLAPNLLLLPPGASKALLVALLHGGIDACGGQLSISAVEPTPFSL
jgi:hypothetical protein